MLRLFFRLPPVGYFVLAALILGLGFFLQQAQGKRDDERAAARLADKPAVVDLGAFAASDIGLADEVNIAAQINSAYTYTLYKDSESDPNRRTMWVLFDPAATDREKTVRAAILLRSAEADRFTDWLIENIQSVGPMSPIFHFNGLHDRSVPYGDIAKDAMDDENLVRARDFFFLTPFINGRDAGLAPGGNGGLSILMLAAILAFAIAAIGGAKLLMRRRRSAAV